MSAEPARGGPRAANGSGLDEQAEFGPVGTNLVSYHFLQRLLLLLQAEHQASLENPGRMYTGDSEKLPGYFWQSLMFILKCQKPGKYIDVERCFRMMG